MNGPSPEEVLKAQLELEQKKRLSLDAQKDELLEKERLEKEKNDKKDTKSAKEFPMTFNLFNFRKVFESQIIISLIEVSRPQMIDCFSICFFRIESSRTVEHFF